MTTQSNHNNSQPRGRRASRMLIASVAAIVFALFASFAVAYANNGTETTIETKSAGEATIETVQAKPASAQAMTLPPAPLTIGTGEPAEDPGFRPQDPPCPAGMIYHQGECLEFIPPNDDCPPGTIEHNGECLEFEVPDCGPGFILEGLDCVPLTIEEPAEPGDDCPPGTIYHDGQCLEFEVPDCGPGFILEGLECVPLTLEASPAPTPAPTPIPLPTPAAPSTPERAPAPLPGDGCPQGTIYHDGQCIEFNPPSDDCPEGTIEHNGECLEFEVPECDLGFILEGLECVPLTLEGSPVPTPAPGAPTLERAPSSVPGDDCPQGTIYHDGQCIEFEVPTGDCPAGTIEHNGECLEFEVPDCDLGYVLVGLDCVKLTLDVSPVQVPARVGR